MLFVIIFIGLLIFVVFMYFVNNVEDNEVIISLCFNGVFIIYLFLFGYCVSKLVSIELLLVFIFVISC